MRRFYQDSRIVKRNERETALEDQNRCTIQFIEQRSPAISGMLNQDDIILENKENLEGSSCCEANKREHKSNYEGYSTFESGD